MACRYIYTDSSEVARVHLHSIKKSINHVFKSIRFKCALVDLNMKLKLPVDGSESQRVSHLFNRFVQTVYLPRNNECLYEWISCYFQWSNKTQLCVALRHTTVLLWLWLNYFLGKLEQKQTILTKLSLKCNNISLHKISIPFAVVQILRKKHPCLCDIAKLYNLI